MFKGKRYLKNDRLFISEALPEIAIRLPDAFAYLGENDFILEDKAQINRYHFLDGADGVVHRLVILHFERFLPGNPNIINYRPPNPPDHAGPNYRFTLEPVRLGEHDYIHNTWFYDAAEAVQAEPDKELGRTARLLAQHGYALPSAVQMSRYLRILGPARKSELILFYKEPLANTGFRLADFVVGGAGAAEFDRLWAKLTERSGQVFTIEWG